MASTVEIRTGGFTIRPDMRLKCELRTWLVRMHQFAYIKKPKRGPTGLLWAAERTLKAKWYIADDDLNCVRVHHTYLEDFKRMHSHCDIEYKVIPPVTGIDAPFTMKEWFKPREEQPTYIEYLSDAKNGVHRTLPAAPGTGKTVTDLAVLSKVGKRAFILIPPYLRDNWLETIKEFTNLEVDEFDYISGGKELKKVMQEIVDDTFNLKLTLCSINTFQAYLSSYQFDATYPLDPEQFFTMGGFASKTVDEAHTFMEFHFRVALYCNMDFYINLTGTLFKEDEFMIDMENRMFPPESRCPVPEPSNHVAFKAYQYFFTGRTPDVTGPQGYSHIKLESELQRFPSQLEAYYLNMAKIAYTDYLLPREEGDRGLVWFAKTELADGFMDFITNNELVARFFETLKIGRFKAGDGNEVFMGLDLIISTTRKSGTGVDIPNLIWVGQSVSTSSKNENAQNAGRLRNLKEKETTFSRLYCPQLPKHVEYHNKVLEELDPYVHSKKIIPLSLYIPKPTQEDFVHAKSLDEERRNIKRHNRQKQHLRVQKANKRKAKRKYFR